MCEFLSGKAFVPRDKLIASGFNITRFCDRSGYEKALLDQLINTAKIRSSIEKVLINFATPHGRDDKWLLRRLLYEYVDRALSTKSRHVSAAD